MQHRVALRCAPWTWPWPLPAAAAWVAAWALFGIAQPAVGAGAAVLLALLPGVLVASALAQRWRRALVALGFPLSVLASGWAADLPAWIWLLPLLALVFAYPRRAWQDAPLFPTPAHALDGVAALVPLAPGARVIDAGCGLGHGLQALQRTWPEARVEGVECSALLAGLARWRCPAAQVRRGDMWALSWRGAALVYMFQRPESMARAWDKACAELAPGTWLLSLDFAVPGRRPDLERPVGSRHRLLGWRVPMPAAALNRTRSAPITPGNARGEHPRAGS